MRLSPLITIALAITYPAYGFSYNVEVLSTKIIDESGNTISSPEALTSYSIVGEVINNSDQILRFTYIVLVRDEHGITHWLGFKAFDAKASEKLLVSIGDFWEPDLDGKYTVQTFIWSDLEKPVPLSASKSMLLQVISRTPSQGDR